MPAPAMPTIARWSTEGVPAEKKLDYWTGAICDAYLRLECSSSAPRGFDGVIESVPAGGLVFTRMEASSQVIRNVPSAPGGCKDAFYLVTDRHSPWTLKQAGRVRQLRAGDLALIDAREPYQVVFQEGIAISTAELPSSWLRTYLRVIDFVGPRAIARDAGWGRVLSGLCLELSNDLRLVTQAPGEWIADQLGGLLAAAAEPIDEERPARAAASLTVQAEQLLAQRLGEPGLTAAAVALALGVSVRSLHRAFAARGTSFACTLREARLRQAMQLLDRRNLDALCVAEIGARCGFRDPSHFSRVFHERCGVAPGQWRQRPANP